MKAQKIQITYEINGTTKVANHSNQSVVYAVNIINNALRTINRNGDSIPHARIIGVEAEY